MTNKFWIRWGIILFISAIYYIVIFYFNIIFAVNYSETMSMGGDFSSSQCVWFARQLLSDHNYVFIVSVVGFLICMPLILLAFKKIR
ncbi:hypothetical protein FPX20_19860 [Salmonella enterica]|nr:hypothetical protein [Salmonella enterica subsp. houtenae serovar 44:z4,z23:-]ECH5285887.1 hypothetical protein [Salmonella enterica]